MLTNIVNQVLNIVKINVLNIMRNEKSKLISDDKVFYQFDKYEQVESCNRRKFSRLVRSLKTAEVMNSSRLPQQYSYNDKDWQDEHLESYGRWTNELNSLGVEPERMKDIDDLQEPCSITQMLKETLFQYYKANS
jgi:hypothetical protein